MINPLVSVVIPNYNHACYLQERLNSVLTQTYNNFEVIILDDCSTDNSREVIERYRNNPHVSHIVYNNKNSGKIFNQWHRGMELAKGQLIWIAESDDYCEPNLLEVLVKAILKQTDCVVAFCDSKTFGDEINNSSTEVYGIKEGIYSGKDFIANYMTRGTVIGNASSAIFMKDIALNIPRIFTDFKGAGDRFFWTLMAEKGKVAYIDKPLNHYRLHVNNSTKRYYATGVNQREDLKILNYIYERGYISHHQYIIRRRQYCWTYVFCGMPKGKTQTEILHEYGYGTLGIIWLRIKAQLKKSH